MIWLSSSAVARLRDRLREHGQRSAASESTTAALGPGDAPAPFADFGAISEAMFLMMSADGKVSPEERAVLRGALANLSGDAVRTSHIEAMLDQAAKRVSEQGRDARL